MTVNLVLDDELRQPMVTLLDAELRAAWIAGRIGWATICPGDGLPNACHAIAMPPWGGPRALPEERALGIPAGTFAAIRRCWRDERRMPARWS